MPSRRSVTRKRGVALAMEGGVAEDLLLTTGALEKEPDLLGVGHADAAVQLHGLVA
jgi:hypothetical protein